MPEAKPVLETTLGPGSWAVSAKSFGERSGSMDSTFYACDLVVGPLVDRSIVNLTPPVMWSTMSHQLAFTTAIEISATLSCRGNYTTVNEAKLTAIKVGSVDQQSYPPPS